MGFVSGLREASICLFSFVLGLTSKSGKSPQSSTAVTYRVTSYSTQECARCRCTPSIFHLNALCFISRFPETNTWLLQETPLLCVQKGRTAYGKDNTEIAR